MKYTITLYNNWKQPYFYVEKTNKLCTNIESSIYSTDDLDLAKTIAKDFLDVPESELTLEKIKKQFEDPRCGILPKHKLVAIQNYYNGRLSIYKKLIEDISRLKDSEEKDLKYNIPQEYNCFGVYDDEQHNKKQIEAYIEFKVEQ